MTDSNDLSLFNTIFPDNDDIDDKMDPGLTRINQMFAHLNFDEISKYYDLQLYNDCFTDKNREILSIFHFNIRGAHYNKTDLETLLHCMKQQPDIIALTETWFNETDDRNFVLDGYKMFNEIRDKPRGLSLISSRIFEPSEK